MHTFKVIFHIVVTAILGNMYHNSCWLHPLSWQEETTVAYSLALKTRPSLIIQPSTKNNKNSGYFIRATSCNLTANIGGGKGGAMGLQPHLILRVLHKILIFTIEIFSFQ